MEVPTKRVTNKGRTIIVRSKNSLHFDGSSESVVMVSDLKGRKQCQWLAVGMIFGTRVHHDGRIEELGSFSPEAMLQSSPVDFQQNDLSLGFKCHRKEHAKT